MRKIHDFKLKYPRDNFLINYKIILWFENIFMFIKFCFRQKERKLFSKVNLVGYYNKLNFIINKSVKLNNTNNNEKEKSIKT